MSRLYRWIIAVLLMLCLPLQGMAAVALPIGMTHETPAQVVAFEQAAHQDEMSDHCMQHAHHDVQPEKSSSACDNCFTCHITISQALMPATAQIHLIPAGVLAGISIGDKIATLTFPFFRPPILA